MAQGHVWTGGSRKLASLLLALVALPAITLAWLGLRILDQDRALVAQRELEHRQAAAQNAVRSLEQSLAAAERSMSEDPVGDGMVRFTLSSTGILAAPPDRILWLPAPRAMLEADTQPFTDAEGQEFRGDAASALATYQALSRSSQPAMRAGALLRVARIERRQMRWDQAIDAYRALADIRAIAVDGVPVDLIARRASAEIFAETKRPDNLSSTVASLESDFLRGRWMLDRSAWELTAADIERWSGHALPVSPDRRLLSSVAQALWSDWQKPGERPSASRRLVTAGETPVTVLERLQDGQETALAIPPSALKAWTERAIAAGSSSREPLSLLTTSGGLLAGRQPAPSAVKVSGADTGLPWTVAVSPGDSLAQTADLAGRRRLLGAGLAAILLLFAGGSYFLWRVVRQELKVARLQTDFVAAVSHEFRTPLTSLRHVTELLAENDEVPPERRRSFYGALGRNTERLQRLVESLLDFSRMEGGRKAYDRQPIDACELAARVVTDFSQEAMARHHDVQLDGGFDSPALVLADAPSLINALWNLLDNAVKYSPDGGVVRLSIRRHPSGVSISVRDEGLGIPAEERKAIFDRFVRGRKAAQLGIKGTGLGLAMVSHIVQAHDGTIELESEEGIGSIFTIVLPLAGPPEGGHYVPTAVRSVRLQPDRDLRL